MGTTLLSIIGSLLVFLLGLILWLVKSTRQDLVHMEEHFDEKLESAKKEIMEKVPKPDCIREMGEAKDSIKEIFKDIREIERRIK